jgi:hypothetical protein
MPHKLDGTFMKWVNAGRVLVDSAKRGTSFRPPAGQSTSDAKSALWRR